MIKSVASVFFITIFLMTGALAQGQGASANGQPFDALQQQIDALKTQVENLTAAFNLDSLEISVDCAAGETVGGAIGSVSDLPNSLIITIRGTCNESVFILRSNVTLVGESPGDGVRSILASRGASHVEVESLTLEGGNIGLSCLSGATVTARNINILNTTTGVLALNGGNCDISDSTIDNNANGLTIGVSSQVWLRGVTVTNSSNAGANVYTSSSISLNSSPTGSTPTTIGGSFRGLQIFSNGSARLSDVIIEDNEAEGIWVNSGGSAFFESRSNVEVRNNGRHGISIGNLANASLNGTLNITGNAILGMQCIGTHYIGNNNPPGYSGNGTDISPNCELSP
jgi:hypothetical protein